MNKKFSTLLTACLLVAGSLFSSAYADDPIKVPIGEALKTLKGGEKVFIGQANSNLENGKGILQVDSLLGHSNQGTKTATHYKLQVTGATTDENGTTAASITDRAKLKNFIWTVSRKAEPAINPNKFYYTFTNDSTGQALKVRVNADGDAYEVVKSNSSADASGATDQFILEKNEGVFGAEEKDSTAFFKPNLALGLSLDLKTADLAAFSAGGAASVRFYTVAPDSVDAKMLNDRAKGEFALKYAGATSTPFMGAMKAFEVNNNTDNLTDGIYFATSWPKELNDVDSITETDMAAFKKAVVIAVDPEERYTINNLFAKDGEGYKFTTVKVSKLYGVDYSNGEGTFGTTDVHEGRIHSNNAAFQVDAAWGDTKNYTLSLDSAYVAYVDADGDDVYAKNAVYIAAVASGSNKYVTTVTEAHLNTANAKTCTIDASNVKDAMEFFEGEDMVFNIKFTSNVEDRDDKTIAEYGKYLGVTQQDSLIVRPASFIDLDVPENQWYIANVSKDNNTVTFANRDLNNVSFTSQLITVDEDELEYKLYGVSGRDSLVVGYTTKRGGYAIEADSIGLSGTTVQLIPVTVNPEAGFVTTELDNRGLVSIVAEAATANKLMAGTLYVTSSKEDEEDEYGEWTIEMTQYEESANSWSIIKHEEPLESYNNIAYLNSKGEVKTNVKSDTIRVYTYSFKLHGEEDDVYLTVNDEDEFALAEKDDVEKAPRFIIKKNVEGDYSLIYSGDTDNTEYREVVKIGKDGRVEAETWSVTDEGTLKAAGEIFNDYNAEFTFTFEGGETNASLKHEPGHVTFNAFGYGYMAMNPETNFGVVAPVGTLKAAYTKEDLTFYLDTADTEAFTPSFYISKAGNFLYFAGDSVKAFDDDDAQEYVDKFAYNEDDNILKAYFKEATLVDSETLKTVVDGEEETVTVEESKKTLGGLNNFKYQITQFDAEDPAEGYTIKAVGEGLYLRNINGVLVFAEEDPLVVEVEGAEAPVANDAIEATAVKVIAVDGAIIVKGAAGKAVVITNVLGQTIANTVVTSDEATIAAPAGIVVVAVEGEAAVKAIVK